MGVRHLGDLADGVDGAERVRDVRHGDEPRARAEPPRELVERHLAAVVDRRHGEPRPALGAEELPGDDVRVVLELGDQHLVAGADARGGPKVWATRLIASVVPRTKTISPGSAAPTKRCTRARAAS